MNTGKVEYAPDYKSKSRQSLSGVEQFFTRGTSTDGIDTKVLSEHQRLRLAVVEKSKAAQQSLASLTFLNIDVGTLIRELIAANKALIEFEARHEIREK